MKRENIEITGNAFESSKPGEIDFQKGDVYYCLKNDSHVDPLDRFNHIETYVYNGKDWDKLLLRKIISEGFFYSLPSVITKLKKEEINRRILQVISFSKNSIVLWDGKNYKN